MEQQKEIVTLAKPNAFITSLRKSSAITIARFSRYKPDTIDEIIELNHKHADNLDSLNRSLKFFETEYNADDKDTFIEKIQVEIRKASDLLLQTPKVETIGTLYRIDEAGLLKGLKILINDLRLFFTVDSVISNEGIESLCPLIIFEYASLSLEEITVCFAQAKKGYYKFYNRLDGPIILSWIKQYATDKLERLKERNYVRDSHAKIGIKEGYKDFRGTHDKLVQDAYTMIADEKHKKNK